MRNLGYRELLEKKYSTDRKEYLAGDDNEVYMYRGEVTPEGLAEMESKINDMTAELHVLYLYSNGTLGSYEPRKPGDEEEIDRLKKEVSDFEDLLDKRHPSHLIGGSTFDVPYIWYRNRNTPAEQKELEHLRMRLAAARLRQPGALLDPAKEVKSKSGPAWFSSSYSSFEVKDSHDTTSSSQPEVKNRSNSFAPVLEPNNVEDLDPIYSKFGI